MNQLGKYRTHIALIFLFLGIACSPTSSKNSLRGAKVDAGKSEDVKISTVKVGSESNTSDKQDLNEFKADTQDILNQSIGQVDLSLAITSEPKVKNCPQIMLSMSRATGIPLGNQKVQQALKSLESGCPKSSSLADFSTDNAALVAQLSLAFCNQYASLFLNTSGIRNVSFSDDPYTVYNDEANRKELYTTFYRELWGRDRSTAQDLIAIQPKLEELMNALMDPKMTKGENEEVPAFNKRAHLGILEATCTVYLSGAPIIGL